MEKLGLTCTKGSVIGLPGSAYFLGLVLASAVTPLISEKVGRKRPYIASLVLQSIAYILIITSNNIYWTIVLYFFVGLAAAGRIEVGLNYMNECLPEKWQPLITTFLCCGDASTMIF